MRLRTADFRLRFPLIVFILALSVCMTIRISTSLAGVESQCTGFYFGYNGAPDYSKALKCFEDEKNYEFLILMHLNGEGTPVDVAEAAELFKEWEKSGPGETQDPQAEALRKAIEGRTRNPGAAHPRLDYCTDIAEDTVSMNFCGWVHEQFAQTRFLETIEAMKAKLGAADAAALDGVSKAFVTFMESESRRMYQKYVDGTIRNQAALGQKSMVRDNFMKLIVETVDQRGLKPSNDKNYKAADKELNDEYRKSLRDYAKIYEDLLEGESSEETKSSYTENIKSFREYSKNAQIRWIRYRDLFAEFVVRLYEDQRKKFDPALSMKTEMTKIRVAELKNDPVGEQ